MPQDSYPWSTRNGGSITDNEYEHVASAEQVDGLLPLADPTSQAPVYADGSGMQVFLWAGLAAIVRGRYWTAGDATLPLPVVANAADQPRIDLVVLRLDRPAAQITAQVIQGAPAANPTPPPPARTPDGLWDVLIAQVRVEAGVTAISEDKIALIYSFADSGWLPFATDSPSVWATARELRLRRTGRWVYLRGALTRQGSTLKTSDPDGSRLMTVPEGLRPFYDHYTTVYVDGGIVGKTTLAQDTGQLWLTQYSADIPVGRTVWISTTWPAA